MTKRYLLLLLPIAIAACQDTSTPGLTEQAALAEVAPERRLMIQEPERVYPGRVLARFVDGVRAEDVAPAYGLTVERHGRGNVFVVLRGAAAGNERALAARLSGDTRVVYAEPDYLRQPTVIDPTLWAFSNPGGLAILYTSGRNRNQPVTSFLSVNDADEDNIAGYGSSGSDVTIGSIDTGVDFAHPEFLGGQLIAGQDWYSGDSDPTDEDGHGTHTTGTMVGQNVGVAGVAGAGPNVKVLVQRVCGPLGCPTSAIVSAITAAADHGVVAMNLSLGGSSESQAEKEAIAYAWNLGALVIASAGNDGTGTVSCPACDPLAISVGATNWQDGLTYYTNWGAGLDITAPGGQMYSNTTDESGIYSAWPGGGYRYLQGTSMAAPQVTGTAAVVASVTGLRGLDLRKRLLSTTDDKGTSGYDISFGCGRLNSYRAVTGQNSDGSNNVFTGSPCDPPGGTPPPPPPPPPSLTSSFSYNCGGNSTCNFDGSGSTGATTYTWAFGDAATGTGVTATHTYAADGNFTVTLTTGDGSSTASSSQTVSCSAKGKRLRCS